MLTDQAFLCLPYDAISVGYLYKRLHASLKPSPFVVDNFLLWITLWITFEGKLPSSCLSNNLSNTVSLGCFALGLPRLRLALGKG
jgi:hypothetical protein